MDDGGRGLARDETLLIPDDALLSEFEFEEHLEFVFEEYALLFGLLLERSGEKLLLF